MKVNHKTMLDNEKLLKYNIVAKFQIGSCYFALSRSTSSAETTLNIIICLALLMEGMTFPKMRGFGVKFVCVATAREENL